jgi:hypothetical protein
LQQWHIMDTQLSTILNSYSSKHHQPIGKSDMWNTNEIHLDIIFCQFSTLSPWMCIYNFKYLYIWRVGPHLDSSSRIHNF